jgi:hypothetical protein
MSPDDVFNLWVGVVAVGLIFMAFAGLALKKFYGIDIRVEFYIAQAQMIGAWYDRREQREAAARGGRSPERHPTKRKN